MSAAVAKPESDYPSVGAANYGVVLLFLAYVLSFLDRNILSLLVGPIREQFGISDFQYSLLAGAAFALVYSFASLPLGLLADRYSRKLIVAASVAFWSLATAAGGLANGVGQLFASRMAVGAGEAGLAPPAYSIITDSYRPAHFGYAMSFYKTGVRVGGGFALVIGGLLIDYYTRIGPVDLPLIGTLQPWQATLVTVGLPGVLLALLLLTMVEPKRKELAVSRSGRERLPVGEFVKFVWERKRVYLPLFIGSSMLAMAGYGSSAWYPRVPDPQLRPEPRGRRNELRDDHDHHGGGRHHGGALDREPPRGARLQGRLCAHPAGDDADRHAAFDSGAVGGQRDAHPAGTGPRDDLLGRLPGRHGGCVSADHAQPDARPGDGLLHLPDQLHRHGPWHQHPCRVHRLPVPGRRQAALLARHYAGDLQAGRAILFWYCLSAYRKAMEEAGKWEVD